MGSSVTRAAAAGWWVPPLGSQPWQWELSHPLVLTHPTDMGTNDKLPNRQPAPAPDLSGIDGIINSSDTVAALHAMGKHVVCYVVVAAGNYYSASDEGIPVTYYQQLRERASSGRGSPTIPSTTSTSSRRPRCPSSSP